MAIEHELSLFRKAFLWIDDAIPSDLNEALNLFGYAARADKSCSALFELGYIESLAGAVFVSSPKDPSRLLDNIASHLMNLLDAGCLVWIISPDPYLADVIKKLRALAVPATWPGQNGNEIFDGNRVSAPSERGPLFFPYVSVYKNFTAVELLRQLIKHGAKVPLVQDIASLFALAGSGALAVQKTDRTMLRRAFSDCAEVHLTELDDGKSTCRVYLAHTKPRLSSLGRHPVPYFVKIGPRRQIIQEWWAYEGQVRHYVPFHLSPRLSKERCSLGGERGILVGDFVDESESLKQSCLEGRPSTAIGNLFSRTLSGWHSQAVKRRDVLSKYLCGLLSGFVPRKRMAAAARLGATRGLRKIRRELISRSKEFMFVAPIHGDLHADNVRVRGGDAIVIDFLSSRPGPILSDYAALEVGLLVRAPSKKAFHCGDWTRAARRLISKDALSGRVGLIDPTDRYAWMVRAIEQIRIHALSFQLEKGQYARVLAFHLVRAAIKDANASSDENRRRATALALANSIIDLTW